IFVEDRVKPVYNERGVIAESYHDLQGLEVLKMAREAYPLPKASGESTLRAVFQAAEIALLNVADVLARAAMDVEHGMMNSAVTKMFWARGFHRLLVRLSMVPHQFGLMCDAGGRQGVLRICESPGFREYVRVLNLFDRNVLLRTEAGDLQIETAVAEQSL